MNIVYLTEYDASPVVSVPAKSTYFPGVSVP